MIVERLRQFIWTGVILVTMILPAEVPSQDRGRFLEEIIENCSEEDLTIRGDEEDVTVYFGESDGVEVADSDFVWYCGKYRESANCPYQTNYVWISRTDERRFYIECYER